MCGIYGYVGKPTNTEKLLDLFIDLGILTETRGTHATGYYGVNDSGVQTDKAPLRATDFFLQEKKFYDLYENCPTVMLGHNRWASCGDPKINSNNHPFTNERFGFIHNGCVKGWVEFKPLGIQVTTQCDSEWIFQYFLKTLALHHGNIFSAIKKTLNIFDQATMACAMVDSKTKKLWLYRNIGNPICYTICKELGVLIYASTEAILEAALTRHGIEGSKFVDVAKGQILCIDEDLNIESNETANLRGARSSYVSSAVSSWKKKSGNISYLPKPEKKKITSTHGFKCLKCGKKFISVAHVEDHLFDDHELYEHLDEDEDVTDYWEDLSKSSFPLIKKTQNRKADFKVVKHNGFKVLQQPKEFTKSYKTFEDMKQDTEEILKQLEAMPS